MVFFFTPDQASRKTCYAADPHFWLTSRVIHHHTTAAAVAFTRKEPPPTAWPNGEHRTTSPPCRPRLATPAAAKRPRHPNQTGEWERGSQVSRDRRFINHGSTHFFSMLRQTSPCISLLPKAGRPPHMAAARAQQQAPEAGPPC